MTPRPSDPTVTIALCDLQEVMKYAGPARAEHVAVGPTKKPTTWFAARFPDGELAGFAAWMAFTSRVARFKGVFVLPEWRKLGFGDRLSREVMNRALDDGYRTIDLYSWDPRWGLRNGFTKAGENTFGATHLVRTFTEGERL